MKRQIPAVEHLKETRWMQGFHRQVSGYMPRITEIRLEWVSSRRPLSFPYRSDTVPHQSAQIVRVQLHQCIGDVYWGD